VVPPGVLRTREDPPFARPAAGLAAGLAAARAAAEGAGTMPDWVVCLGCDQPGAPGVVPALSAAAATAPPEVDAIAVTASPRGLLDEVRAPRTESRSGASGGRREDGGGAQIEWMLSIIRRDALSRVVAERGAGRLVDCSMRRLLGPLRWACTPVAAGVTDDIDTWDDHARWQQRVVPG
jgi:CTP:molybdopterin cytidylyltransferase MocA